MIAPDRSAQMSASAAASRICASKFAWSFMSRPFECSGALAPSFSCVRNMLPPALRAQAAGRTFAAAETPVVARAALAEITGVGMLADQVDEPRTAEVVRELPGRGLAEPHQRGVQFERPGHAERQRIS